MIRDLLGDEGWQFPRPFLVERGLRDTGRRATAALSWMRFSRPSTPAHGQNLSRTRCSLRYDCTDCLPCACCTVASRA